jgi:hypothetical protein
MRKELPTLEGIIIFSVVGYETLALTVNYLCGKKVFPPITDLLGPLTHSKFGKIVTWLFLGWAYDHFWKKGESMYIERLLAEINGR